MDLYFTISSEAVSSSRLRGDFNFEIVNFPFLNNNVPHSASSGVCVYQLVQFVLASDCVAEFNTSCLLLTQKLLKQGYRYHKLCKTLFLNFTPDTVVWCPCSMLGLGLY